MTSLLKSILCVMLLPLVLPVILIIRGWLLLDKSWQAELNERCKCW